MMGHRHVEQAALLYESSLEKPVPASLTIFYGPSTDLLSLVS